MTQVRPAALRGLLLVVLSAWAVLAGALVARGQVQREDAASDRLPAAEWGEIRLLDSGLELHVLDSSKVTAAAVRIPRLNNPVAAIYLQGDKDRKPLKLTPGLQDWEIGLPAETAAARRLVVIVETVGRPRIARIPPVVKPSAAGVVTLVAHDAVTHGERMRFEPQAHKNTLGYWSQPADWCQWHFSLEKSGRYEVQILQGCGKGQAGSEVTIHVGGQELRFTVEETGHFQNFKRRTLGTVALNSGADQTLEIRPRTKAAAAVMDVRQVRLLPITPEPRT